MTMPPMYSGSTIVAPTDETVTDQHGSEAQLAALGDAEAFLAQAADTTRPEQERLINVLAGIGYGLVAQGYATAGSPISSTYVGP